MRRTAQFFTAVGATIAVVAVGAYALGFRPSTLSPALLNLAVYKLVFITAGCLIAAGAAAGRAVRRRDADAFHATPVELTEGGATEAWQASVKSREDVRR